MNPFGKTAKALELNGDLLQITKGRRKQSLSLEAVNAAPVVRKGAFGAMLTIPSDSGGDVVLKAAAKVEAAAFSEIFKAAWIRFNRAA